jgi:hypothetical protein
MIEALVGIYLITLVPKIVVRIAKGETKTDRTN